MLRFYPGRKGQLVYIFIKKLKNLCFLAMKKSFYQAKVISATLASNRKAFHLLRNEEFFDERETENELLVLNYKFDLKEFESL